MAKKQKALLQLNAFKNWQFGNYTITQYKPMLFIVSNSGKDIMSRRTLRGAVKFANRHAKVN